MTVPTNNEDREALIQTIAHAGVLHGTGTSTAMQVAALPEKFADAILAAGFRRPPVSVDNTELIAVTHEWLETGGIVPADAQVIRKLLEALEASQPREAAPSDTDRESLAWVDRHNDVWVFPGGGDIGYSFETQPFSREHIEKKWGPLEPLSRASQSREVRTVEWGTALYESADEWRPEGPERSRAVAEAEVALSRGDLVLVHRLVSPWEIFTPSTPNQTGAEQ